MKKITFLAAVFASFTMNAQIFFEDFNSEIVDETTFINWNAVDFDGDGENWEVFDAEADGLPWLLNGLAVDSDSWESDNSLTPDNFLITKDPIDLTNVTGTNISFIVGTYQTNSSFIDDKYSVYLTASNNVSDILSETPIDTRLVSDDVIPNAGDGSDSSALVSIDASAYDGQMVYLTFRHYESDSNNSVLLDNILVNGILGVTDESFNGFNYYVNNRNILKLSANNTLDQIEIYNALGQQVISQKLSSTNEEISLAFFETGIYVAKVSIEGNTKTFKVIKN